MGAKHRQLDRIKLIGQTTKLLGQKYVYEIKLSSELALVAEWAFKRLQIQVAETQRSQV